MGLRFRKSINLGGGFRINLSKSGIGYSYGVKGFRRTRKAGGGKRTTIGIPGTGLSYVKDSHKTTSKKNIKNNNSKQVTTEYDLPQKDITETTSSDFVRHLNKSTVCYRLFKIFAILTAILLFLAGASEAIIAIVYGSIAALMLILTIILVLCSIIHLEYTFENDEQYKSLEELYEGVETLSAIERKWEITDFHLRGNKGEIKKNEISIKKFKPFYLRSDIKLKAISMQGRTFVFFPDILAVKQSKNKWVGIDYKDLKAEYHDTQFLETEKVANDTEVCGSSYLHATKSGEADKRYSYNPIVPVCEYAGIYLADKMGWEVNLVFSNRERANKFYLSLVNYINT